MNALRYDEDLDCWVATAAVSASEGCRRGELEVDGRDSKNKKKKKKKKKRHSSAEVELGTCCCDPALHLLDGCWNRMGALNLKAVACLAVILLMAQGTYQTHRSTASKSNDAASCTENCADPKQDDGSCEGRCGDNLDTNLSCQCNDECSQFGDCCDDYSSLCEGGTCNGRCGDNLDESYPCQCNDECSQFGDCCSDYEQICNGAGGGGSCEGRCGDNLDEGSSCQCNDQCSDFGDCCSDYEELCDGGGDGGNGGGDLSDAGLEAEAEFLLSLDLNNGNGKVNLNYQGEADGNNCGQDNAPDNLLSDFDESLWDFDTYSLLRALFDNYDADENNSEDLTDAEIAEQEAFLDAVFAKPVMTEVYNFLNSNGAFSGSSSEFRAYVNELWFGLYARDATDSSSGFEHVFMGEIDSGEVGGFHNWLHYKVAEDDGEINYRGWLVQADFGQYAKGITNVHTWKGADKCIGGFLVGTSPELDLALFTMCAITREGQQCPVSFGGVPFKVQTYVDNHNGNDHIGSAYPIFD